MRQKQAKEVRALLNKFLKEIDSYDVYTIMSVRNIMQTAALEAYKQGKISQEVCDKICFPEEEPS